MDVRAVISGRSCVNLNELGGAVAQLGARLDGIEEVVGSNPIGSTNFTIFLLSTLPLRCNPQPSLQVLWLERHFLEELSHGNDPALSNSNPCRQRLPSH
jgi:hypothetical protein